jgi:hypothetical protein
MRHPHSWLQLVVSGVLGTALFAAASTLTYDTSGYFQRERDYHDEVRDFFTRPEAKALFAGDSHVAQLDNSLLAPGAYNIAWGGDSLREVYAKLRYLLWRGARIDTLFLTADTHMFGNGRLESSNRAFVDRYLLLTWSPYGLAQGRPSAALGTVPLFNDDFVQYLKKKISVSFKPHSATGVREDPDAWLKLTDAEREADARRTGVEDHEGIGTHREPFLWYERIAALAHENGIRVVAVLYPAHPAYLESVPAPADAAVAAELAALGIHDVLDFRAAFRDPSYFADPDHVSQKGAVALLQLLGRRTGRQLLADTPAGTAAVEAGSRE